LTPSATFRDRLWDRFSGAAIAIALQAGLLALLVFSFQVVRHLGQEKENILILPPLVRDAPRTPVTIDARGRPPLTARPASPTVLPPYALPSFNPSAPQSGTAPLGGAGAEDLGRQIAKCGPANYGNLNASERKACPPPVALARPDPNLVPLNPDKPVKNAPIWQAEVDRRNAPVALPGAEGGILGILGALLTGGFGDKRNYSYAPPEAPPMDGAEMTRQYALHGSGCPELDDTTKRNCQHDRAALPGVSVAIGAPLPSHPHVSDAAFLEALAATQARTRSLYARPVLASGAKAGDGNEKNGSSDGAGAAAGGTGSTGR
jgi:hypothetical protein